MRMSRFLAGVCLCALLCPLRALGEALPSDVKSSHWAASSVQQVLNNGVLSVGANGKFDGEALVTQTQAVIAMAKLARALEAGTWRTETSKPLSGKVVTTLKQGNWKQRPLTRYTLASILSRFGSYVANGLPRTDITSKDRGKSEAIPARATVKIARAHPAYESVQYLAKNRMLWPGSSFLNPSSKPVRGEEMSRALGEMAAGLTDRMTALGFDETGSTPDKSFRKKRQ